MSEPFEVDTAKVKEAARQIKAVASQVQELADRKVRPMTNMINNELKGETAEALQEVLGELGSDIRKIASNLNTIQRALNTYAKEIQKKDAELAAKIGG